MTNQPTLWDSLTPDPEPLARRTDPATSRKAADRTPIRATSQNARLLAIYAVVDNATDDEAAQAAGLLTKPGCCWWHRCSDLRKLCMIEPDGTRISKLTGEERMTCRITPQGRQLAQQLK